MTDYELYHGDCLTILPTLAGRSIDAVICDPPYGVTLGTDKDMRGGRHGLGKRRYTGYGDTYEEYIQVVPPALMMALRIARRGAVFVGPHIQELPKATAIGGVYCPAGTGRHAWGFKTFLPILFYGKDPELHKGARPNTIKSTAHAEKNGHPCPKPLEWMVWLVERVTSPGDIVLDPFMGSGTTGHACANTGRRFIGIERDAGYFEIASERIATAYAPLRHMEMAV